MKTDMPSMLTNALSGVQVGVDKARTASNEIAKLTTGSKGVQDTVRPLLALGEAERDVAVASKVASVENDTLGRFVDETV